MPFLGAIWIPTKFRLFSNVGSTIFTPLGSSVKREPKCEVSLDFVILIKITQCHCLDYTFLQNGYTDFDETLHVAWVCLPEGFGNSGRSGYSPVQKKGGLRVL